MFDPKSMADAIVAGDDPEALASGVPTDGDMDEGDLAAEDVLAAFAENDPKALKSALQAIFASFEKKPHAEAGEE